MLLAFLAAQHALATFTISDDTYTTGPNTVKLKVLTNTLTNERVSVLLNCGGGVDDLFLAPKSGVNTSLRRVLWDHGRNATAAITNPTWKGRVLLPYANRIGGAKYNWNGSEYHLPINDVAGLNNSLHGLLWDRELRVASQHSDNDSANLTLEYEFNEPGRASSQAQGYPFHLRVRITYILAPHSFSMIVAAENVDSTGWPLPYFNGWHPYFLCHPCSEAHVVLDPRTKWAHVDVGVGPQFPPPRYSNMVPTTHVSPWSRCNGTDPIGPAQSPPGAPAYMDDEVKALSTDAEGFDTSLYDPNTRQSVRLWHDSTMRYLQIFTGAMASFPDTPVDAVVLEPLSAMSDSYNNYDGLHSISAGETYVSQMSVRVLSESGRETEGDW